MLLCEGRIELHGSGDATNERLQGFRTDPSYKCTLGRRVRVTNDIFGELCRGLDSTSDTSSSSEAPPPEFCDFQETATAMLQVLRMNLMRDGGFALGFGGRLK